MSLRDNEHAVHSVEGPSASGCTSFAQLELSLLIAARPQQYASVLLGANVSLG